MAEVTVPSENSGSPEVVGQLQAFTKRTGSVKVPGGESVPIEEQVHEGTSVPVVPSTDK